MPSLPFARSVAYRESVRRNLTPIKATTVGIIAKFCERVASFHGSPGAGLRVVRNLVTIEGSSRE
jgi:hypothetical protein